MDTRRIRRLRDPLRIEVQEGPDGLPLRILLGKAWREVTLARPPWRIDQHWWRGESIKRDYFQVAPADSPVLTIYHDLASGEWARQEYTGASASNERSGLKKKPGLNRSYAPASRPPSRRAYPRSSRR